MLKICFSILLLLFSVSVYCQTVSIPDTNFRKFLRKNSTGLITASGNLDIARAARIAGSLICQNCNIRNVEGLQYFTGLTTIILDSNLLSFLPDLSGLNSLQSLNVRFNSLTILPDLASLKRLKYLRVNNNKLRNLPVHKNDSLELVNAGSNDLDTLPDLSRLGRLYYLNLSANNLSSIPGLDKLRSLQYFYGSSNRLTNLPSLHALTEIQGFEVADNKLTLAPYFGKNSKITSLHFHMNEVTTLPDYSGYTALVSSWITKNNLTFTDLVSLTSVKNYQKIFNISPQNIIKTGSAIVVKKGESISLNTFTDQNISSVNYEWYKNGKIDTIISKSELVLINSEESKSGKYVCRLKHSLFPGIFVQTDTFYVTVLPCPEFNALTFNVTEINCIQTGSLTINGQENLRYSLKTPNGSKIISSSGQFTGLTETYYILTAYDEKGCLNEYTKPIIIPQKECRDFLITPDNDGNMDTYYFSEKGIVKIFDKKGHLVKEMKIPGEWDCISENGKVPVGYYIAYINEGESQIGLSIMY